MKNRNKKPLVLILLAAVLLSLAIGTAAYLNDYYRADSTAQAAFRDAMEEREVIYFGGDPLDSKSADHMVFFPENPSAGLIFYPGGKVEYSAYIPLMKKLAEQNILCVLVHMRGNLAILDMNAADGLKDIYKESADILSTAYPELEKWKNYPNVSNWYIGGHSLGGVAAASYLSKHSDEYQGLILLGSYSTADLTATDLTVLSIYGSEDGVLNRDSYEANRSNLPKETTTEFIIEGGCHAWFGNYGEQEGDGTPTITQEEQQQITVEQITEMISKNRRQ